MLEMGRWSTSQAEDKNMPWSYWVDAFLTKETAFGMLRVVDGLDVDHGP